MSEYLKSTGKKRLFNELLKRSIMSNEIWRKIQEFRDLRGPRDVFDPIEMKFDESYFAGFCMAKDAEETELINHYRIEYELTDEDIKEVKRMIREMEMY